MGNVFFDFLKLKKKLNCFFFAHFEGLKIKYLKNFKFCCDFSFMLKDGICNQKNSKVPVIFSK